ncbi:MFS transporter [Nanoarchaeota archaeon]
MSLLSNVHINEFFRNKELNEFYAATIIMYFAEGLISIFVPIYLYKLGYSIPIIILFSFLISLSFVVFSYLGARVVSKIGVKHSMLLSTPFNLAFYLGLGILPKFPFLFFILPILRSWKMILFNYGYHLDFIKNSDGKRRGREISVILELFVIATALSPFIGGLIASFLGFNVLYFLGSMLLVLGTFPLFLTKDGPEKIRFSKGTLWKSILGKKERNNLISLSSYGIESIVGKVLWPLFLIILLVEVFKTGLIVTLSMLFSVVFFYFIGELTDRNSRRKMFRIGTYFYALSWIGRVFVSSPFQAFFVDSYRNITEKIVHIPWLAKSYDIAKEKGYFKFIVGREVIFNLSRVVFLPVFMLIFYIGYKPFIISFILAGIFTLGYQFLGKK